MHTPRHSRRSLLPKILALDGSVCIATQPQARKPGRQRCELQSDDAQAGAQASQRQHHSTEATSEIQNARARVTGIS
jgi:hypothetical protein